MGEVWTVVVAAGSGRRFGADKLRAEIHPGSTVLDLAIGGAVASSDGAVVVVRSGDPLLSEPCQPGVVVVTGGDSRSASARRGVDAVPEQAEVILIHDAARPLAHGALYARVIDAVRAGATVVVPVVPVVDTIRAVDGGPVDRDRLRAVQTPQGFRADVVRDAHARGGEATDDASLAEALGHAVVLVDGDVRNLKITRAADVAVARALWRHEEAGD